MKALAKTLAWIALLTAIVWAATIVYWSRTHRAITQADVVLYLVALPVVVVLGFFMLRWAWRRSGEKAAAQASASSATGAAASPSVAANAAADERRWSARVLAQWVRTAAGDDAAAVWTAVRDSEVRPRPDAELLDKDGHPLFTTRLDDVALDSVRAELTDLPPPSNGTHPAEPAPRLVRSLSLLSPCADWLDTSLAVWADARTNLPTAPALTVALCLPPLDEMRDDDTTEPPQQALARAWLAPQLGALQAFDPRQHRLLVQTAHSGADVLAWADLQLVQWQRDQRPGLLVLLVADSLIDEASAARLARQGLLMSGRQPKGATLGEAAVGLLLATPDWPAPSAHAPFELDHPPATLHRWAQRVRSKSADDAGRIGPEVARDTLGDALQASAVPPDAVQAAVCDTDLRPSRTTEWYGAMLQHIGHLDAAQDVAALGVALGDCGIAQAALCVALAAQRAATEQQAVVAATVSAPLARGAVVLQPAPTEADAATSPALPLAA